MKTSAITFACTVAALFAFSSCSLFYDNIPSRSNKVVSYKLIRGPFDEYFSEEPKYYGDFISNKEILKAWFPHIFDNEQAESRCNYFVIYFGASSTANRYWVLSANMVLYEIKPSNRSRCLSTENIAFHAMLVCDDTAEGNLKDRIDINSVHSRTDSDWDCKKKSEHGIGVFF
jgi:hypothetical protein